MSIAIQVSKSVSGFSWVSTDTNWHRLSDLLAAIPISATGCTRVRLVAPTTLTAKGSANASAVSIGAPKIDVPATIITVDTLPADGSGNQWLHREQTGLIWVKANTLGDGVEFTIEAS